MAIYFAMVKPIKRSDGRSSVAAAAYRSGTKLNDKKYGVVHNYTRKDGVVYSEVMLPNHAPSDFANRENLWNSVEEVEKSKNARVAREVIVALPYELTPEERINVTRAYAYDSFVRQGMCADFSIHEPKVKREGQAENPHAHIMLTTRSLDQSGQWADKKRKDYILDREGKKQYDPVKKTYKFRTYSVTDWDRKEKIEQWRAEWATMVNREFARKGIGERIDHRSNQRQGLILLPQVHLGVAAHRMEQRGIQTELGNRNRDRMATNQLYIKDFKNLMERVEHLEQTGGHTEFSDVAAPSTATDPVVLYDANHQKADAVEGLFNREAKAQGVMDGEPAHAMGNDGHGEAFQTKLDAFLDLEAEYATVFKQFHDLNHQIQRQQNIRASFEERTGELTAIRGQSKALREQREGLPVWDFTGRKELDGVLAQLSMRAERAERSILRSFRFDDEGAPPQRQVDANFVESRKRAYGQQIAALEAEKRQLPDLEAIKCRRDLKKAEVITLFRSHPDAMAHLPKPEETIQNRRDAKRSIGEQLVRERAQRAIYRELGIQAAQEPEKDRERSQGRSMGR